MQHSFTKKYTSLSNAVAVNPLAEVTSIRDHEFTTAQHGQRWHSRLVCWIKDSTRSFFSPLRKNNPNDAWQGLSFDLMADDTISEYNKTLAKRRIKRWQKGGVPLRKLHVIRLLRQLDEDFASQRTSAITCWTMDGVDHLIEIQNSPQTGSTNLESQGSLQTEDVSQKTLDSSQTGNANLENQGSLQTEDVSQKTLDSSQTEDTEKLGTSWQNHNLESVSKDIKDSGDSVGKSSRSGTETPSFSAGVKSDTGLEAPIQIETHEPEDSIQTEVANQKTLDSSQTEDTEKLGTSWQNHNLEAVSKDIKDSGDSVGKSSRSGTETPSFSAGVKSDTGLEAPIQIETPRTGRLHSNRGRQSGNSEFPSNSGH